MTPEAIDRLEQAARALLAAIELGECVPEAVEIEALRWLLEHAGLMRLAVTYQRVYAQAALREIMQPARVTH